MVEIISDNIISPLGFSTKENYECVKNGKTALKTFFFSGIASEITAALFSKEQTSALALEGFSRFESLVLRSIENAIKNCREDFKPEQAVFILSTTKGNIELLDENSKNEKFSVSQSAKKIADYFNFSSSPITICNACISGVHAIITAQRLLEKGFYKYAVVCGADLQSLFTISGFFSLKAMSNDKCRPFDLERLGMNLGEAGATIILKQSDQKENTSNQNWKIISGIVRNDAYHISSPSKNGEGSFLAIESAVNEEIKQDLAFINAHGTATMFNDQMEASAISRAGLNNVPVNALKGFFGHTLGAAGILETIISKAAIEDKTVLGTLGYTERGVSAELILSNQNTKTDKETFLKLISGFGGCNAALVVSKNVFPKKKISDFSIKKTHHVVLKPNILTIDNQEITKETDGDFLTEIYKNRINDYPKFYKMDPLSRLGFISSEMLKIFIKTENSPEEISTVFFNNSSSIVSDKNFLKTISNPNDFFPSPSIFIYTLPNIVTGEIAVRNGFKGETAFYILDKKDEETMQKIISTVFLDKEIRHVIGGWLNYNSPEDFLADLFIFSKN